MWSEHCSYKSSQDLPEEAPDAGQERRPGAGRERRHHRHRRRAGRRLQDRIAQPPLVHRALPGRGDGGRRHPARHLHHGRAADRPDGLAALRPARQPAGTGPSWKASSPASPPTATPSACRRSGGEVYFDECYSLNPLVNVFCLGLAEKDKIFYAKTEAVGNAVLYVGAKTGRDGIHGASMASPGIRRGHRGQAAQRPGRRPVQGKAPARGLPRGHGPADHRRHPGHGRGRADLLDDRDAGQERPGRRHRPGQGAPAREGHDPLRDHAAASRRSGCSSPAGPTRSRPSRPPSPSGTWTPSRSARSRATGSSSAASTASRSWTSRFGAVVDLCPIYHRPLEAPAEPAERTAAVAAADRRARGLTARRCSALLASPTIANKEWVYRQYDHMVLVNTWSCRARARRCCGSRARRRAWP